MPKIFPMRKARQLSALMIVISLFDYLFYRFNLSDTRNDYAISNMAYHLVMLIMFFFLFLTLFYNSFFTLKSNLWVIIPTLFLSLVLSVFMSGRLKILMLAYEKEFAKRVHTTVDAHLHRFDDRRLWRGNPHTTGFYHYNLGDTLFGKVEVFYDSLGHKTVPDSLRMNTDTLDMIIGCSFSYGYFLKGEEGYPYLVTKALNHRFMNASMGGYGLAQMQMRLDSLLPIHKFKYVFIQISPWLASRSMSLRGEYAIGYPSVHYFARSGSGIKLMPQAYESPNYQTIADYKKLADWHTFGRKYLERMRFFLTEGLELYVKGYLELQYAHLKIFLGFLPAPIEDKYSLETAFYDKAISDVRKSGAIPILVKLYWDDGGFEPLRQHLEGKALIVDCDRRLDSVSKSLGISKHLLYGIYVEKQGKKLYFDDHPNPFANRLIADEIHARIPKAR